LFSTRGECIESAFGSGRRFVVPSAVRRALLFACLTLASSPAAGQDPHLGIPEGGGPIDCGPVPAGIDAIDARSCGECHPQHYREWRRSAHRSSFTNRLFQAEFRHRRAPFCGRCHAPREDETTGIDCAACHVRDGAVLSPIVSGRAPHASRATPELAGTIACVRCHQFPFEGQPELLLQATIDEWMQSRHNDTSCQSCHLPARGDRHAHDFAGGLDREMIARAITVDAETDGATVRLTMRANEAAHAVPTGDVFRRLAVRAWPAGDPGAAVETILGRTFRFGRHGRRPLEDTRIPARGARVVELTLARPARRVAYTIELWRIHPGRARERGWPLEDLRRTLASGVVDAR
jgi:hypothetical protein